MVSYRCLQKTYPAQLPSLSVILIFLNEALSVIQRAITSIINQTPPRLLKEIILVDDFSSHGEEPEGRISKHDYHWSSELGRKEVVPWEFGTW